MKLSGPLLFSELNITFTGFKFRDRRDKEKYIYKFLNKGESQKNIDTSMSPMHIEGIYDYFSEPPTNTEFVKVVWDSPENKHPIIERAMHYCENEEGASKQGYIDLVEMASDLT
jgi:hypothetical protein